MIQDSHPSMTLGVLFFVIHVFRMTTFFLIAGFFAHMSFHRRGAFGFIRDRLQRIAVPLVVGWPILFAAMARSLFWAANFPNGGPLPGPPGWPPVLPQFPLTHLWFLYVLLEFYAALLVLRAGVVWLDQDGRFRDRVDRVVGLVMHSRFAPALLAVPSASPLASIRMVRAGSACERQIHPSSPISSLALFRHGVCVRLAAASPDQFDQDSGATLVAQSGAVDRPDRR